MINTEYRIVELHRMFSIEVKKGKEWGDLNLYGVPRFFKSLADARLWVATIKKGVVYHDAEEQKEHLCEFNRMIDGTCFICGSKDAPNLAQDERKAEDDTSDGIKPLEWFEERIGKSVLRANCGICFPVSILSEEDAIRCYVMQKSIGNRYSDPL